MNYYTHILPNGLRLVHLPVDSPVAYCGFAVDAGTREEGADEYGLAHFVEHMLFKGTAKRKAWHIINRMENVGGELNAYTTKEETFIYSVFMENDFNRAFELLTDIVFHSRFPENEIDKEVDVILDEINSYRDSPSELIYDEFENMLYNGHPLGHNILGDEKSLLSFTPASGLSFLDRFYTFENMVFFSMGKKPFSSIVRQAEQMLADKTSGQYKRPACKPLHPKAQVKQVKMNTHQAHILIGGQTFSMYDDRRMALFLLNNILGGPGMNSRLNLLLREKNGWVYNVDSSITSYTDTGLFSIYCGTDVKNMEKVIGLILKELQRLRTDRLSDTSLTAAKKQAIGQLGIASDQKESRFLSFGKSILHHNYYRTLPEMIQQIEAVTANKIIEVAHDVYHPDNLSQLIFT